MVLRLIHSFHLANTNHRFKEWTSLGLTTYYSLINKGEVKSFQDLKDLYGLQNLDHFRYLQKQMLSHNEHKKSVFDPFPRLQLHVSQPPGTRAAGENPGQPPRGGAGLLQQRPMSAAAPPLPSSPKHAATTRSQAGGPSANPPPSFSVPKLSLCLLLISSSQDGPRPVGGAPVDVIVVFFFFIVTDKKNFSNWAPARSFSNGVSGPRAVLKSGHFYPCSIFKSVSC